MTTTYRWKKFSVNKKAVYGTRHTRINPENSYYAFDESFSDFGKYYYGSIDVETSTDGRVTRLKGSNRYNTPAIGRCFFNHANVSSTTNDYYYKIMSEGGQFDWAYQEFRVSTYVASYNRSKGSTQYDDVFSNDRSAYPDNGYKGDYWYKYDGIENEEPIISGEDNDLGSKTEDFDISYFIADPDGDPCTVTIKIDGVIKTENQSVELGKTYKIPIVMRDFTLGKHTVVITATDGTVVVTRTYYFTKSNSAPIISGEDGDLGGRSTNFTLAYTVSDINEDAVDVVVTLDEVEIQSVSGAQGREQLVTVTEEQIAPMQLGSTHRIVIRADDGKGGVAYRYYTFTRSNRPPVISGTDTAHGDVTVFAPLTFTVTDQEGDEITLAVYLDGEEIQAPAVVPDGEEQTYTMPQKDWIRLPYGEHTLELKAWDEANAETPTVQRHTFKRVSGGLDVEIKINEFDTMPTKVIAVPHGTFADDAVITVKVCNNYLDAAPKWEDATSMSKIARAYTFTNNTKTAAKWSLGVKVIVANGESGLPSVLRGLKGGYE